MADFIEREAALEAIQNLYPGIPFTKRLMQKWHEENRNFMQCEIAIERLPAADVVPGSDFRTCRNELCLRCGQYKTAHLGSCDSCRWRH